MPFHLISHCPYLILLLGFWQTELIEMTEEKLLLRGTEKQYLEMRSIKMNIN